MVGRLCMSLPNPDADRPVHVLIAVMENLSRAIRYHPLRTFCVALGLFLVLFSTQVHAVGYAPFGAALSTNELQLQPGTELPIKVNVIVPTGGNIPVSFSVQSASGITLDGQLHPIAANYPFSRNLMVKAASNAKLGSYVLILNVNMVQDGVTHTYALPLHVNVVPKADVSFFTSDDSTASPFISSPQISPSALVMKRNESTSVVVSFRNNGSATDYEIVTDYVLGLQIRVHNPTHRLVFPGQTVSSVIDIQSSPDSPFQEYIIGVRARNMVTNESFSLGHVNAKLVQSVNVMAAFPFNSVELPPNGRVDANLTISNLEYGDVDVVLQSDSSAIQLSSTLVHIPQQSSVSIPVVITGDASPSSRVETIYVMTPTSTQPLSFVRKTILSSAGNIPGTAAGDNGSITGLFSFARFPWVAAVIIVVAIGLIFLWSRRSIVSPFAEYLDNHPKTIRQGPMKSVEKEPTPAPPASAPGTVEPSKRIEAPVPMPEIKQ